MTTNDEINAVYNDLGSGGAFSGPNKIKEALEAKGVNIKLSEIKQWLKHQDSFTLYAPAIRNFKTGVTLTESIDHIWDADLFELPKLKKANNNIGKILLVIDMFSKYVWLEPLRDKTGKTMVDALNRIFKKGRRPRIIRSDMGGEFLNSKVQSFLKRKNIIHYTTKNTMKAQIAERAIRTIKMYIHRYLKHKNTLKYIDKLQKIAQTYNSSYHSSIGVAPINVNASNARAIWWYLYRPKKVNKIKPYKFNIGDYVRISTLTHKFAKEAVERWTEEIFKISSRFRRSGIPIYKITNIDSSEPIIGTFYEAEMQKINYDPDKLWVVEKILKTKGTGSKKRSLVKWQGYSDAHNSWVLSSTITKV